MEKTLEQVNSEIEKLSEEIDKLYREKEKILSKRPSPDLVGKYIYQKHAGNYDLYLKVESMDESVYGDRRAVGIGIIQYWDGSFKIEPWSKCTVLERNKEEEEDYTVISKEEYNKALSEVISKINK